MPPDEERRTKATLATVAEAAGVSMPTVSKVLNGRQDVADTTRKRVQQALKESGYLRVNTRSPKPSVRMIDLAFDDVVSPYSIEVLRGVTDAAAEQDVDVVIEKFGRFADNGLDDRWARRSRLAGREGIITVTTELTDEHVAAFERARLPMVMIDPVNPPRRDIASVGATNWAGGMTATQHLIELGHRRIAYIAGPPGATCSQARLFGHLAALSQEGIPYDPELVRGDGFTAEVGFAATVGLMQLADAPTAIFAGCDATAVGVLEAAQALGLSVPDDFSVVGFDNTYLAQHAFPKLTTIDQPLQEMGRVALRTLLSLAAGQTLDSHHVELATQLVIRNSTAPPPANQHDRTRRTP
jgi:LacI family transcriptional regulator